MSFLSTLQLITIQEFFTVLTICLITWYCYYFHCFNYWRKKGVPFHPPSFPTGNIAQPLLGKVNLFEAIANFYTEFKKKGYRHAGLYFFNGPVYFPIDPEIVKHMLTTDFDHFVDRGVFIDEEKFPLSAHLFSLTGSKWKNLRAKISPTFTSGKLKSMYEIFLKMTENFVDTIESTTLKDEEINIKHVATNFTSDIIFSTAFGLEGGSLKDPNNKMGRAVLSFFNPSVWFFVKVIITEGLHNPGNLFKTTLYSKFHKTFFQELVKKTMKLREENNITRNDFFSLLMEVKKKEGLTFNEIVAQCFIFFVAGFETSSATISYCIHELAHHQDLQDKLRKEIFENLGTDFRKFTYEGIFKLPYLDKVFNETLRLHPVLGFFNRICDKPYKIPGTDVVLDKDTPVIIPILGLQRDPEYFPDPLEFNPERFNEDQAQVPFTFLPFGEGPRFCIGMRYGKLQTKLGIAALVSRFKFLPSPKTSKHVEMDKFSKTFVMVPKKGLFVKASKI
jgi:cytochrome P450 family 6